MPSLSRIQTTALGNSGAELGMRNRIINGDMRINQRGAASVNTNVGFPVDRFYDVMSTGVITMSQSSTAPAGFTNSIYAAVTTADSTLSAGAQYAIRQVIEGYNIADLGWGTANAQAVTISFWVRSSITGTYCVSIRNSTVDRAYSATYTINAANTWEYKTITVAGDASGTWLTTNGVGAYLQWTLGANSSYNITPNSWQVNSGMSTAGATQWISTSGATFYITGVQLEKGSTATSFDYRPYGTELALCQRYLPCINTTGTTGYEIGNGFYALTTDGRITVPFVVETRVPPTGVTVVNPANFTINGDANSIASAVVFGGAGTKAGTLDVTIPSTSIVLGHGCHMFGNASGTAQIQFTGCEL